MAAHLLEVSVVLPLAADEDRVQLGLHVVVDAALAGAAQDRERAVVRVEYHLLPTQDEVEGFEPSLSGKLFPAAELL